MTRQRTLTAIGTAAVALGLVLGAAAPAVAHNYIVESTPTEGETYTELPEFWFITTNENLLDLGGEGQGFAMLVTDEDGAFYGDSCLTVQGPTLSMPAALGAAGDYTLTYQFVSADGHSLSGEIPFTWQPPADFEPHVGLDAAPVCGETASAPAPAPSATPTAEPEPTTEPSATAESEQPADDSGAVLWILGIVLALIVIGGIIAAVAANAKARARREQSSGDGAVLASDGGGAPKQHDTPDSASGGGDSGASAGAGDGGGGGGGGD